MLNSNSTKRLTNELELIENESVRFIKNSNCYILKIDFSMDIKNDVNDKIINKLFNISNHNFIKSIYRNSRQIILIFSACNEEETHQNKGNHHLIISSYCPVVIRNIPEANKVNFQILEFSSEIKLSLYIKNLILLQSKQILQKYSKENIDNKLLHFRTNKELYEYLNINWDDIPNNEKYGIVSKLKNKKDIENISEDFDSRNIKKFCKLIL